MGRISQMRRFPMVLLLGVLVSAVAADSRDDLLSELDYLHYFDRNEEILELLDQQRPANDYERGQLLWRRGRAMLSIADLSNWEGTMSDAEALALLEESDAIALKAVELVPEEAKAHMWRAAGIGRRGLLRGVLSSLFLASEVRDHATLALEYDPTLPEAYYVLGQLYRELPRWPISFGNNDYAVSLSRSSVAFYEEILATGTVPVQYYDHYTQLAHSLWTRNSNLRQRVRRWERAREEYGRAETALERGFHFEGTQPRPRTTDREEALEIIRRVVRELSSVSDPRVRQRMDLAKARELLESWE
ncbi:MAG: hypothetical protein EA427_12845 [Spirochaetaceae bacterium]|nr:MAG: hypothetical protein EA427_12845 [Spirochaetaceae bacterium]